MQFLETWKSSILKIIFLYNFQNFRNNSIFVAKFSYFPTVPPEKPVLAWLLIYEPCPRRPWIPRSIAKKNRGWPGGWWFHSWSSLEPPSSQLGARVTTIMTRRLHRGTGKESRGLWPALWDWHQPFSSPETEAHTHTHTLSNSQSDVAFLVHGEEFSWNF